MSKQHLKWIFLVIISSSVIACSSVVPQRKAIYKNSQSLPSLEVPPPLSEPEIDNSMVLPAIASVSSAKTGQIQQYTTNEQVLIRPSDITVKRHGNQRWLVIHAPAEQVWNKVREYWLQAGFVLTIDNQKIGILETDWAENRADIPTGPVRRVIGKALDLLYSASTRDKFRVRLEKVDADTTELFLTHRGLEEIAQEDTTIWQARPSDPELEAEMLNKILVFWSGKQQQKQIQKKLLMAEQADVKKPQLIEEEGQQWLQMDNDFSTAWRLVGLALERGSFLVEDRDIDRSIYQVRYADPLQDEKKRGWLNKIGLFNRSNKVKELVYKIKLEEVGQIIKVTVLDEQDKASHSKTAQRILGLLKEQL